MSMDFTYNGSPTEALNVANGNGYAIQQMIGIEQLDCCGSIDARTLLSRLATIDPRQHVRATRDNSGVEISDEGVRPVCRVIDCGLHVEQIERYVDALRAIAIGALARGEEVTWG